MGRGDATNISVSPSSGSSSNDVCTAVELSLAVKVRHDCSEGAILGEEVLLDGMGRSSEGGGSDRGCITLLP